MSVSVLENKGSCYSWPAPSKLVVPVFDMAQTEWKQKEGLRAACRFGGALPHSCPQPERSPSEVQSCLTNIYCAKYSKEKHTVSGPKVAMIKRGKFRKEKIALLMITHYS